MNVPPHLQNQRLRQIFHQLNSRFNFNWIFKNAYQLCIIGRKSKIDRFGSDRRRHSNLPDRYLREKNSKNTGKLARMWWTKWRESTDRRSGSHEGGLRNHPTHRKIRHHVHRSHFWLWFGAHSFEISNRQISFLKEFFEMGSVRWRHRRCLRPLWPDVAKVSDVSDDTIFRRLTELSIQR